MIVCGEPSGEICVHCTKDVCDNHRCDKCHSAQRVVLELCLDGRHGAAVGGEAQDINHRQAGEIHLTRKVRTGERYFAEAKEEDLH